MQVHTKRKEEFRVNIVFTVCNRKELAGALLLAKQIGQNPDYKFVLGWVDSEPITSLPENIAVISVDQTESLKWACSDHSYFDFELVAATRPWFALEILRQYPECRSLRFLAPSVVLYSPLTSDDLQEFDLVLCPNITGPITQKGGPDDKQILNIGMFNSGNWVMRPTRHTVAFFNWWSARTQKRAHFDLCNGMCMDQLWLNYAPVFVPNFGFSTNVHLGLHNLKSVTLTQSGKVVSVNGEALYSADFAGLISFHPVWSGYRKTAMRSPLFKKLFSSYKQLAEQHRVAFADTEPGYGLAHHTPDSDIKKAVLQQLHSIKESIEQFEI